MERNWEKSDHNSKIIFWSLKYIIILFEITRKPQMITFFLFKSDEIILPVGLEESNYNNEKILPII